MTVDGVIDYDTSDDELNEDDNENEQNIGVVKFDEEVVIDNAWNEIKSNVF